MRPRGKYAFIDIETHNAGRQYEMSPRDFFRLGQYAWDDGPVQLTTDYDEMISVIRSAPYVVAHNGISFDLSVLFGTDSIEPLKMAQDRRVIDTLVLASLLTPAPYSYTDAKGHTYFDAAKPAQAMKYFGLENLCFQFGIEGKFGDLKELAKKHNPPGTLVRDLDFGLIPLGDPEFLAYAEQDVIAVRGLFKHLMVQQQIDQYDSEYLWREQELAAVLAQVTRNGIRPNTELAHARVEEQRKLIESTMEWLREEFDFPTKGKQPWKSAAGKEAILSALKSYGITPTHPEWTKTAKGAPSFSGDTMRAVTEGTDAERLGEALAALQGIRSIAALVLESTTADGRMHPDITMFQRSGRFSVTRPGITVIDPANKDLLLADEGYVCVELDFSNADARAVAALSGDEEFAKRFETDADGNDLHDGHNLSGEAFFGEEQYYSTLDENGKPALRPVAKAATHAMGYGIGSKKLAGTLTDAAKKAGLDREFTQEDAQDIIDAYNTSYPLIARWKQRVVNEGDDFGYVTNSWGRRMPIDFAGATHKPWESDAPRSRSFTQSPSLYGQSTTREMMADTLLRLARKGEKWAKCIRSIIHDALVVDLPKETVDTDVQVVVECMEAVFDPKTRVGLKMNFPVGVGPLDATNWKGGAH